MSWRLLASGPLAPADFALTWLIQSTALLAFGLLAGRLLKRTGPAIQSACYRTTLVAVLLCPWTSMLLAAVGFAGLMVHLPGQITADGAYGLSISPLKPMRDGSIGGRLAQRGDDLDAATDSMAATFPAAQPVTTSARLESSSAPSPSMPKSMDSAETIGRWLWLGLAAWLFGSTLLAARLFVSQRRMAHLRACAIPAEPNAEALCNDLAIAMGLSPPLVLRTPFLSSPCLDGLRRPAILLPEDAVESLVETFVHELAHLSRRDGLWNLVRRCSIVLLWGQPLLWVLSRRMELAAEEVCDDSVVQWGADRARYAGLLLDLAKRNLPPLAPSAVGIISLRSLLARRVTRILDSSRTLSTRAGARAVAATLLAGLVGTLLAGLIEVGGRNLDVLADEPKAEKPRTALNPARNATAKIVNQANEMPITGRILDLEGRPVAKATVRIISYATPRTGDLTPWLNAVKSGQPATIARQHLNSIEASTTGPLKATTDRQGRFQIESVGAERIANVLLEGPTIASAFFTVVTRPIEPFRARGFPLNHGPGTETIYGTDFTYSAAPGRPVEGIVRDGKTKKPLAGVIIQSARRLITNTAVIPYIETTTDDDGRFRLVGLSKERVPQPRANAGNPNLLTVLPNDHQPYFMRNVPVPDPPGIESVSVEVELHRGIWITGKVTDKKTGEPIKDVALHYLPFLENQFAQATPEFGPNRSVLVIHQDRYKTKSDGTYRLVGLLGHAIVGVAARDRLPYRFGYGSEAIEGMDQRGHYATWWHPFPAGKDWLMSMKEINAAERTEVVHVDLVLDAGDSVKVRVVDPGGKPLSGSRVTRRISTSNFETMLQPDFDVLALGPGEERSMLVWHEERKLGKVVRARAGDDKAGPMVVTLEPLATIAGRVEDSDGNPVSGAVVWATLLPPGSNNSRLNRVATGQNGRFQVQDVPTGCDYSLVVQTRGIPNIGRTTMHPTPVIVRPGQTTDVGTIQLKRN
jgi:beta-lactamase regulating signal transducer with metallopeptidase domain